LDFATLSFITGSALRVYVSEMYRLEMTSKPKIIYVSGYQRFDHICHYTIIEAFLRIDLPFDSRSFSSS
jgi:hypothetical protein